ncbi:MAG: sulfur carrier protein ThiS [Pseudomonadota bacterium]
MTLIVNGQKRDCTSRTLAALLDELRYGDAIVATAVNGDFVAADARAKTPVSAGDRIEILAPMKGG